MPNIRPYLTQALRRVRLEAALALAEQNRAAEDDRLRLATQLDEVRRALAAPRPQDEPLEALARRLGLRPIDELVLVAAMALEVDPLFSIAASALGGEEPRHGLSPKLMGQILRFAGDDALELGLDSGHALVQAGLLESSLAGSTPECLRPWRLSSRGLSLLLGRDEVDPLLSRLGGVVHLPRHADFAHAEKALEMLERVLGADEDVIVCVEGPDGVGRRTCLAEAARRHGREVVALDLGRLSTDRGRAFWELRALRRECWLRGAIPVVARLDALARRDGRPGERLADIAEILEAPGATHGVAAVTVASGTELPDFQRRVVRVRLDPPGAQVRAQIWARALEPALAESELAPRLADVVQLYQLTPGAIQRAAANARMFARGRSLVEADVRAGVIAEIQERFSGLATRLVITQGWDDLVLPSDTLDDVKAFASRAAHAALVYDQWGFRAKLGRGLGLAALFSGPPGTGKTMVAGLIAKSLGLELYMVDLAQIVSKWVGETEKQLGKIFDAAAMGQALLLFDEADALFAKRTSDVKSSNDRYANLEVNYLLQRIEQFGGVAILTTNMEAAIDPAFKRRLASEVRFYPPDLEERERLWRTLIPTEAPRGEELEFAAMADAYKEMCGGNIRNAVLRAAFLAAAENQPIANAHLHRAARAEYRAMGKVL